jgi:hypothetical protein
VSLGVRIAGVGGELDRLLLKAADLLPLKFDPLSSTNLKARQAGPL